MKRILRIVNNKTGQFAEAETAIWISTLVAMMPPEQRDSYFNAVRNNVECDWQKPKTAGLVYRGAVLGYGFILSEAE